MSIWRFPYYIHKPSLVPIGLSLFKWANLIYSAYLITWTQMTFGLGMWPLTSWTYEGSHITSINQVWFQSDFMFSNETNLKLSALQLDLRWPLTLYVTSELMNIWRFPHLNKPSLAPIGIKPFKWGEFYIFSPSYNLTSDDLWPWLMTLDHPNIWRVPYYINKPSLVPIKLQLFQWGHFHIFNLSYNLTSDDLWPWYVTFDLINKWGFPCCIYDPSLVENHLSIWTV